MKLKTMIFILFVFWISHFASAKVKIFKTKDRKPADASSDAYLGSLTFLSFLRCGQSENVDPKVVHSCAKSFFSKKLSQNRILNYLEVLTLSSEYSEPYYCSESTKKLIAEMETDKFDFFLCFKSRTTFSGDDSIVFFVNEPGMPRIIKFKM